MGWGGAYGSRALAARATRILWKLAADRGARRPLALNTGIQRNHQTARSGAPELGLARTFFVELDFGSGGTLYQIGDSRAANLRRNKKEGRRSSHADHRRA